MQKYGKYAPDVLAPPTAGDTGAMPPAPSIASRTEKQQTVHTDEHQSRDREQPITDEGAESENGLPLVTSTAAQPPQLISEQQLQPSSQLLDRAQTQSLTVKPSTLNKDIRISESEAQVGDKTTIQCKLEDILRRRKRGRVISYFIRLPVDKEGVTRHAWIPSKNIQPSVVALHEASRARKRALVKRRQRSVIGQC